MTVTLVLPFPVSTNAMYKNVGRRRAVSQRYRDWKTAAGWALRQQYRGTPTSVPIMLQIALRQPDKRRRDLDNLAKALQDLLTGTVIADDSQIKLLFLWWEDNIKGGEARVMIDPIDSPLAKQYLASFDARNKDKTLDYVAENAMKNKRREGAVTPSTPDETLTVIGGRQ